MRRVWTALLLVLTAVVAVGLGYVIVHRDTVPRAGETPGYRDPSALTSPATDSASTLSGTSGTSGAPTTGAPTSPSSSSSSTSGSTGTTRVTLLGDDWVLGVGASDSATSWPRQVAKTLGVDVTALGVAGGGYAKSATSGDTYAALIDRAVRAKPNVLVVLGGRNDASDDSATLSQGVTSFFAELHRRMPRVTLYAVAPFWGDSPHPAKLVPVDNAVRSGIESVGGTYLDLADPLEGHSSWMADDAHPNDRGYQAIASAVASALRSRLPA